MGESSVTPRDAGLTGPEATDGRAVRAERTRAAVVDALLTLNDDGHLRPTARDIADRAGVSVRSLYVHFDDLDALVLAAAQRHGERVAEALPPMVDQGPFAERVEAFVQRRSMLLAASEGVHRAALLQEPTSPALQGSMARARKMLRAEVRHCFAPELAGRPDTAVRPLVHALDVATCSATWDHLRAHQGHGLDEARALVRAMVLALFAGWDRAPAGADGVHAPPMTPSHHEDRTPQGSTT